MGENQQIILNKLHDAEQIKTLLKRQNELLGKTLLSLDQFLFLHKSISRLNFEDIKEILEEKLPYILSIKYFSLFLFDKVQRVLTLSCHNHPKFPDELSLDLHESGIMQDALSQGRYIFEPDFSKSKYFKGKLNPLFKNDFLVCVPLMIENQIIGVLNINDNEKGAFGVGDLDYTLNIVEFISLSISNALLYEKTEMLSVTDGLTQLYNHRQLQNILKSEFNRSKRYQSPLSLIMMDVDHFKTVNDTYGHQMGDEILIALASVISRVCRANDSAARYGGEEFLLVLPETPIEGAKQFADRIRNEFAKKKFKCKEKTFQVTLSCGVAELDVKHMKFSTELIQLADRALYRAKEEGRNRTIVGDLNETISA